MRSKFADICLETVTTDEKAVVMIGDISHFLLRGVESKTPNRFFNIGLRKCSYSSIIIKKELP